MMGAIGIIRFIIGKILIGFMVTVLVFVVLPQYPMDFAIFWVVVTAISTMIGVLLWLVVPARTKTGAARRTG